MKKEQTTIDSKYIQQHLANERTYLAWIRTSITIIGVGFLITNLHFSSPAGKQPVDDILAKTIGLSSIAVGMILIVASTISYFNKGREINLQTFLFPRGLIFFLSTIIFLIFSCFAIYYLFVWGIL